MPHAIEPPAITLLSVVDPEQTFPVHRVYCVGRNYAEHAREMGGDAREPPFFFMKPACAVVDASQNAELPYPTMTNDYQHEIELVVALGAGGHNIREHDALDHVFGYALGLDMTRRDLQAIAKQKRRPWEFSKSFTASAPISEIRRADKIGHPRSGKIELRVNGQQRQSADLSSMIWSVAECIAELSKYDTLQAGDLIMTGTPAGVGPVVPGDRLEGVAEGVAQIDIVIT